MLASGQRPGSRSRASSIGRAKASPTITTAWACSASSASSRTSASNRAEGTVITQPPVLRVDRAKNRPVPCISGQATTIRRPGPPLPKRAAISSDHAGQRNAVAVGCVLVAHGPVRPLAGWPDVEPGPHARHAPAHPFDDFDVLTVEYNRLDIGVIPQVDQLVVQVA